MKNVTKYTCSTKNKVAVIDGDGKTVLQRLNAERMLLPGHVCGWVGLRLNGFKVGKVYSMVCMD